MGQRKFKRSSNISSQSLISTATTDDHPAPLTSPTTTGSPGSYDGSPYDHSNYEITPPAPARVLNRLSEIIDPRDLIQDELYLLTPTRHRSSSQAIPFTFRGLVQSPSGNELGAEEFIMHPDRPLAMWERQERVLQATREGMKRFEMESRMGSHNRMGTRISPITQRKSRGCWWRCSCLC